MADIVNKKIGKATLIKEFFGMTAADAVREYKRLDDKDKVELASAAAREKGLTQEQCDFEMVDY